MCCAAVCWQPPVYVAFFYLSCCCLPLVHGHGLRKPLQRCFHASHAASLPMHGSSSMSPAAVEGLALVLLNPALFAGAEGSAWSRPCARAASSAAARAGRAGAARAGQQPAMDVGLATIGVVLVQVG
jgi:hypothetical protein